MMCLISHTRKPIYSVFAAISFLLCFTAGCQEASPPAQPAVVEKRIEQPPVVVSPAPNVPTQAAEQTALSQPATPQQEKATGVQPESAVASTPPTVGTPAPKETPKPESEPESQPVKPGHLETPVSEPKPGTAAVQPKENEPVSLKATFSENTPRYTPEGKVDPFVPLYSENTGSGENDNKPKRPLTPLEKIDLSQLQLVAILRAQSGNRAMVEDATGKGYILSPGTFVGMNSGKVTEIMEDRVVVEEETKDLLGKATVTKKEIKLQKPFGEE